MTPKQLDALTERWADTVALESTHRPLSYSEVGERSSQLATSLHGLGIRAGDTIGISVKDEIDHFLLTIALLLIGAAQTVVASHDPAAVRSQLTERLRISRVIDDKVLSSLLKKSTKNSARFERSASDESQGGLILKTSGTVSHAKLVPIPFTSLQTQADQHSFYTGARFLRLASIEHNNSKRHRLYCFLNGGTNLFRDIEDDALDFNYLQTSGCTRFDIARSHFASLLETRNERHLPPEIAITIAGSPLPTALRKQFQEEVTPNLSVRYGSTETGTIAIAFPSDHDIEGGVGLPLPGVEIEIDNAELSNSVGALRIRTPGMATHYLDASAHQMSAFDDGWFVPGDLGEVIDSGMLRLHGRTTEAFTLDGVNIFPREIESALLKNPVVKDVAVVKRESSNHDGIPVAFVVVNPRHEFDEFGLLSWARNEMGLASPRQIIALDNLPTSDQGKIDIKALYNQVNG
jgi:acyl-coenzyme A synthetase/AMP-(fatty) acid ligase